MNYSLVLAICAIIGAVIGFTVVEVTRGGPIARVEYQMRDITSGNAVHIICKVRVGETITDFRQCYIKN